MIVEVVLGPQRRKVLAHYVEDSRAAMKVVEDILVLESIQYRY